MRNLAVPKIGGSRVCGHPDRGRACRCNDGGRMDTAMPSDQGGRPTRSRGPLAVVHLVAALGMSMLSSGMLARLWPVLRISRLRESPTLRRGSGPAPDALAVRVPVLAADPRRVSAARELTARAAALRRTPHDALVFHVFVPRVDMAGRPRKNSAAIGIRPCSDKGVAALNRMAPIPRFGDAGGPCRRYRDARPRA